MRRKSYFAIGMCLVFFAGLFQIDCDVVNAKGKAKAAYAEILNNDKYAYQEPGYSCQYYFAIKDLNADGKPELLIQEHGIPVTTEVYTFRRGKAVIMAIYMCQRQENLSYSSEVGLLWKRTSCHIL